MDYHAGFQNNASDVLAAEASLTRDADLLVVTSAWLDRELANANPNRALIRTAGEFEHFSKPPPERYRSEEHTSELQSRMRISYAVFCLTKKKQHNIIQPLLY